MGGYDSGLRAAVMSPIAICFYGLLGAFPIAAGWGAFSGMLASKLSRGSAGTEQKILIAFCLIGGFIVVSVLAVLDKIIGPW